MAEESRTLASSRLLLLVVGDGVHATHTLPATGSISIGRSTDCAVCIDDDSISRNHAVLHLDPPLRIEDVTSSNGSWVGNERLAPHVTHELRINQPVRLGEVTIIVQSCGSRPRTRRLRSHDYFENRVEEECARASRNNGTFAVLHVLQHGDVDIQPQLATALRDVDVVATYAPGELEIMLVDATREQAERVLERVDHKLARTRVPARVGTAWYPRDGRDAGGLAARARDRAYGHVPPQPTEADIVVVGERMTALHELVGRIAASDITVLLLGETGVGKEIVAEMLHRRSARAGKAFVRLNCGALTEALLESELFGHEKGAFTGATHAKQGLFEAAEGGVLFLDEVGELTASTQVKLLRVLDERKVRPVGGIKPRPIDVRLVAATNRDLDQEVRRGNFRLDLLHRLNAMTLVVPPLRERVVEIEPLARAFVRSLSAKLRRPTPRLSDEAIALLRTYSWPGNIRELRNVLERAVILCEDGQIEPADLPQDRIRSTVMGDRLAGANGPAGADGERQQILAALEACAGNQTNAARMLGIARRTLINKIERLSVPRPRKG